MRKLGFLVFMLIISGSSIFADIHGIKGGLVVCVGADALESVSSDWKTPGYVFQCLETDPTKISKLRKTLEQAGIYGKVAVKRYDGKQLPYVDNLINLVIQSAPFNIPSAEMKRVLAPNGSAVVNGKVMTKPWPADMGQWTHWLHGPDNNAVSDDGMSEIPRGLQWVQGPLWLKSHELNPAVSAMVSANGRMFYIIDESAPGVASMPDKWFLVARDAFNGMQLWKKSIKEWGIKYWWPDDGKNFGGNRFSNPHQVLRRLVAVGDEVYVTMGLFAPVTAFDAATGKTIRTYAGSEKAFEIICHEDKLVLAINKTLDKVNAQPDVSIMAFDKKTGKRLWESTGYKGVRPLTKLMTQFVDTAMAVGGKHAFFANQKEIVALNLKNGTKAWTLNRPEVDAKEQPTADLCTLVYHDGILFFSQMNKEERTISNAKLLAIGAASGKVIWDADTSSLAHHTPPDVFINKGQVWTFDSKAKSFVGLDLKTGAEKSKMSANLVMSGTHHNCFRNKATKNFLLYGRNKGVEFFGFDGNMEKRINWAKGACRYGIMPANGMLYFPSHNCGCFVTGKLNGIAAVSSWKTQPLVPSGTEALTKGPAFGKGLGAESKAGDWPTYRQNGERKAFQPAKITAKPKPKWAAKLGGTPTPPVVAAGKVFVAIRDTHRVICLDEASGKVLWNHVASGPVNSPPTYCKGRVVFGSEDGFVYCLDAASGTLVWRFRAAPDSRQIFAFDHLGSAWPAYGSLLVHNDKVYCTAGISSYVNSGLFVYALDLKTGTPITSNHIVLDKDAEGEMKTVINADILVGDGSKMHIRGLVLDMETLKVESEGIGYLRIVKPNHYNEGTITALGGFLDDSWFQSALWSYGENTANIIAVDDGTFYGVNVYKGTSIKSHLHKNFTPGGSNCILTAAKKGAKPAAKSSEKSSKKKKKKGGSASKNPSELWSSPLPIRATALVVGTDRIYLAGVRDKVNDDDPWAHLDGRQGAMLLVCSKANGKTETEIKLAEAPVFDGMAAANGNLFISCKDGSILCFGE